MNTLLPQNYVLRYLEDKSVPWGTNNGFPLLKLLSNIFSKRTVHTCCWWHMRCWGYHLLLEQTYCFPLTGLIHFTMKCFKRVMSCLFKELHNKQHHFAMVCWLGCSWTVHTCFSATFLTVDSSKAHGRVAEILNLYAAFPGDRIITHWRRKIFKSLI